MIENKLLGDIPRQTFDIANRIKVE
jgi:hypothetical protein